MARKLFIICCLVSLLGFVCIQWDAAHAVEEELFYDDGSPEGSWTGGAPGWVMAVCFSPTQYPVFKR